MEYVYVASNINETVPADFSLAALKLNQNVLISMIQAFRQKKSGFDTVKRLAIKLEEHKKELGKKTIYIDSGGYSLIKGDVEFNDTQKLIDSYHQFLQYEKELFDYIFTLDIPLWGGDQKNTTKTNLYSFNCCSLKKTLEIIKECPILADKIYFVWQFANPTQYAVWNQLVQELDINKYIKNRAIGGLVGIRERSPDLAFSPFTTMAFKCFYDYVKGPFTQTSFRLHVLGIYHKTDRLQLILLEKLFTRYCQTNDFPDPVISYDTINYYVSAMMQMKNLQPYRFQNSHLIRYKNIGDVEDDIIREIYNSEPLYNAFMNGKKIFEEQDPSKRQDNPEFLVPLNVYSNLNLDAYLEHIVHSQSLVDMIVEISHKATFIKKVNVFCCKLEKDEKGIFQQNHIKQIKNNLEDLFFLWKWIAEDCPSCEWIQKKIQHTLRQIGIEPFP